MTNRFSTEKDRRIAGPELLSGMKNGLTTLLEEMDYLIDGICKLLTTVEVLVVSFKQKVSKSVSVLIYRRSSGV